MSNGISTMKQPLVDGYTLPATITNTTTITAIPITPPAATPIIAPKLLVTSGSITTSPDNPGMLSIAIRRFLTGAQNPALRSAAINTAAAFSLPQTTAADLATARFNKISLEEIQQTP